MKRRLNGVTLLAAGKCNKTQMPIVFNAICRAWRLLDAVSGACVCITHSADDLVRFVFEKTRCTLVLGPFFLHDGTFLWRCVRAQRQIVKCGISTVPDCNRSAGKDIDWEKKVMSPVAKGVRQRVGAKSRRTLWRCDDWLQGCGLERATRRPVVDMVTWSKTGFCKSGLRRMQKKESRTVLMLNLPWRLRVWGWIRQCMGHRERW